VDIAACVLAMEGRQRGGPGGAHIDFDVSGDGLGGPDQVILECDPGSGFKLDERMVLQYTKYGSADDDGRSRNHKDSHLGRHTHSRLPAEIIVRCPGLADYSKSSGACGEETNLYNSIAWREDRPDVFPYARFMKRFAIFSAAVALAAAQQAARSDVETVLAQGRGEIRNFEKAGGKRGDPSHPVEKWVRTLWTLYEESPRTAEAGKAASEAVHLLIHADRFQEAYERADRVPTDDPAWEGMSEVLLEAGSLQKDFTYFFRKLPAVLSSSTNPTVRAAIQWNLGRAWLGQKRDETAKAAFQAAVESAPDSTSGKQAERQLYELLHLSPGQTAPLFSATAMDGSRISLAEQRGKPVVVIFWSST